MNPFALYLVSGESLYPGAALLMIALIAAPRLRGKWMLRAGSLSAWSGFLLVLAAFVPISTWAYAAFASIFIAWRIALNRKWLRSTLALRIARTAFAIILLVMVAGITIREAAFRRIPTFPQTSFNSLVVIGDSISGIDGGHHPWPLAFESLTGIPTRNLAVSGIGTAEALTIAKKISPDDHLILLEIGGNDLLSNIPTDQFAAQLERLLTTLATPGRTVIMFELPQLPHRIGYGIAQRSLAKSYGVHLLPKRLFVNVLATDGATSDGLHLSQIGADTMTKTVADALAPLLTPPATQPTTKERP